MMKARHAPESVPRFALNSKDFRNGEQAGADLGRRGQEAIEEQAKRQANEQRFDAAERRFEAIRTAHRDAYDVSHDAEDDDDPLGTPDYEDGLPLEEAAEGAFEETKQDGDYGDTEVDAAVEEAEAFERFVRELRGDEFVDRQVADLD